MPTVSPIPPDVSLEEIFTRDPLKLTREDVLSTLPAWRQFRAKLLLGPIPAPKTKKGFAPVDLSALGLGKK